MGKENNFTTQVDQLLSEFRQYGTDEVTINVLRMMAHIERRFLPDTSILQWLKEKALISRASTPPKDRPNL